MIAQPKQPNQPERECLYAWYPEVVLETGHPNPSNPREIYLHSGLDKDLLDDQSSTATGVTSVHKNSNINGELLQRYKQSVAPSDLAYHSTETIDEALSPPWALHYQITRQPATPNPPSNSSEMRSREEPVRRLKSAPLVRSLPPTTVLTIPEPRFIATVVPVPPPSFPTPSRPLTRASSAKGRLSTSAHAEATQARRQARSAQGLHRKDRSGKLSEKEIQEIFERVYGHESPPLPPPPPPVQVIYTEPQSTTPVPPPPVYVYQRSATWCPDERKAKSPTRKLVEVSAVPLNPHYLHRPGVIAVNNVEKKSVVREHSAARKAAQQHHRRYHSQGKRAEPLLAITPIQPKSRLSLEIAGVKLAYDPKLTLEDKSARVTKYFVDGRLYLIKDQRYNVIDHIDPSTVQKYNQSLTLPPRPKYYQTIPVEKFEIPPPAPDLHYNASETYFYNTLPKRVPRYVIDPNFISEELNVTRMSLPKRAPTATVYA